MHYTVYPKCSPQLVADLIVPRAKIHAVFGEKAYKKTALQSLNFWSVVYASNERLLSAMKILGTAGADI